MNLRLRDHFLYWIHQGLSFAGKIQPASLDQIRTDGFQRVLIVATTAIGDAVLCTPLIESLQFLRSRIKLGFWVSKMAAPLFERDHRIDVLISYHGKYQHMGRTMKLLKKESFDLALVANANDPDIIPMIWWSGCKRIIRRPQRNTIYSFMIANPEMLHPSHTTGHAIERNLQFCDLIGIPQSEPKTHLEVQKKTEKIILEKMGNKPKPWWIIHPGASRSAKQWSPENYTLLIDQLLKSHSGTVVLSGHSNEKGICDQIQNRVGIRHRVFNLVGELKLNELAALFKSANLLISGDTGPFHIAMAVGTPTITLFAPWDEGSSAKINGPYFNLDQHLIVTTKKMGDPISSISVDRIFKTCQNLIEKISSNWK